MRHLVHAAVLGAAIVGGGISAAAAQNAPAAPVTGAPAALTVGNPAPALTIDTWVKGEPVTAFEKGRVYVVEFWATWCGPCKVSIPHLTALQKEYGDKVTIIGVSSSERRGLEDVRPFVEKQGDAMAYTVAWDDDGRTGKAWMDAAGQNGIPCAFIVNQDSRIAWIGHPMAGMDDVLTAVVAGSYDMEAAAAKARKRAELQAQVEPLIKQYQRAMGTGDDARALDAIDRLIALDTAEFGGLVAARYQIMAVRMKDPAGANAYAAGMVDGALAKDADALNAVSWSILTAEGVTERDLPLALRAAKRANELSGGKRPEVLDTLAKAYFETGDADTAITTQRAAIDLAPDGMKEELEATLATYLKAKSKN